MISIDLGTPDHGTDTKWQGISTWNSSVPGIWQSGCASVAMRGGQRSSEDLHPLVSHEMDVEQIILALRHAPGEFGIVISNKRYTVASPGRFRTSPLFYRIKANGVLAISDHPIRLLNPSEPVEFHNEAVVDFLTAGYCTGSTTLCKGIQQIPAGHVLIMQSGMDAPEIRRYFIYPSSHDSGLEGGEISRTLHEVYHSVLDDIIKAVGDRTLILPLTGGYDSRLFALLLAERGAKRVHCVTYDIGGRAWELGIARDIARRLGFEWSKAPLTGPLWRKWYNSDEFIDFQLWSSGYANLPHRHEWPTAQFVQRHYGGEDAIVLSGICAGSVAGAFAKDRPVETDVLLAATTDSILDRFFHLSSRIKAQHDKGIRQRIENDLKEMLDHIEDGRDLLPAWEWQERESKYVANAMAVYDWHGIPWAAPFMDHRIGQLWAMVPPRLRQNKTLHQSMTAQLNANLPPANEPEYKRSHTRIIRRLIMSVQMFKYSDLRLIMKQADAQVKSMAKTLHGEGAHVHIVLNRIVSSLGKLN